MKHAATLLALIAIGAGLPGIADAQGRGRGDRDRDRDRPRIEAPRDRDRERPRAESRERGEERRAQPSQRVPLERVLPRLKRRTPGQMVDTWVEGRGGREVYRVRWRSADGRGIDYLVDAETGAIVGVAGE